MRSRPAPGPVYALADLGAHGAEALPGVVEEIAAAGIGWIQLRAKPETGVTDRRLYALVELCCRRLEGSEAELWMDDRADLAALFPVSGLHVGQGDLAPAAARRVIGPELWIGLSTHDLDQVRQAEDDPEVDVVALGPIYPTTGKANPDPVVGLETLAAARRLTTKPLVAIGGVDRRRLAAVLAAGADSAAVLGAVRPGEVAASCRRLLQAAKEGAR